MGRRMFVEGGSSTLKADGSWTIRRLKLCRIFSNFSKAPHMTDS